jgi:hypothetical protein
MFAELHGVITQKTALFIYDDANIAEVLNANEDRVNLV